MKKNTNNKGEKKKYSTQNPSPRLLKALQSIYKNKSGTVNYVFVHEKIVFSKKHPLGTIKKYTSTTSAPINPVIFTKESKGKSYMRSPQEILEIFEGTSHDLGATYFIIN